MSGTNDRPDRPHFARRLLTHLGPLLALLLVIGVFALADALQTDGGRFLTGRNLKNILIQSATVAMASLGMTMIIIGAGVDLSAGVALALCATVMAWCLQHDYGVTVAVLATLGSGCLTGFINGTLISKLRVVPFIVTLGTMTIYLGAAKYLAQNTTVRPLPTQVPIWVGKLLATNVKPDWLLLPPGIWLLLALALFVSLILQKTVFGRHVFAIGSNETAARLCGIQVARTRILLYSFAGLFVGLAGLFQFARLQSGNPTSGNGKELAIIAAVVIGGGSLSGGRGSILGTLTGALIMQVISSGCTALKLPNELQEIIVGGIIIAAVWIDQLRQRRLV
jgi:ribose transport system permease protein